MTDIQNGPSRPGDAHLAGDAVRKINVQCAYCGSELFSQYKRYSIDPVQGHYGIEEEPHGVLICHRGHLTRLDDVIRSS